MPEGGTSWRLFRRGRMQKHLSWWFAIAVAAAFGVFAFMMGLEVAARSDDQDVGPITSLFSFATFGLFLVASALGAMTLMLSLYGREWLERQIDARVDAKVDAKVEKEKQNLIALTYGLTGFLYSELCEDPSEKEEIFRAKARRYAKTSYDMFSDDARGKEIAKNNYIFEAAKLNHSPSAYECVEMAIDIRRKAKNFEDYNYLMTFAQVVLSFHEYFNSSNVGMTAAGAISDARRTLDELLESRNLPEDQRQKVEERKHALDELAK